MTLTKNLRIRTPPGACWRVFSLHTEGLDISTLAQDFPQDKESTECFLACLSDTHIICISVLGVILNPDLNTIRTFNYHKC